MVISVVLNIIVALFIFLAIIAPLQSYFSVMLALFGIYFAINCFYKKRSGKKWFSCNKINCNILRGFGLFFLCLFISSFITLDMNNIGLTFSFFKAAMSFFMIFYMLTENRTVIGVQIGVLVSVLMISSCSFMQILENPSARIDCFYGNPNDFAKMIISLVPCLIYLSWHMPMKFKLIAIIECVAIFFCLVMTASRGSLLSTSVGAIVAVLGVCQGRNWGYDKRKIKRVVLCLCLVIVVGISSLWIIQSQRVGVSVTGGERIPMWESSVSMMIDHPMIGVGATNWNREYVEKYHKPGVQELNLGFPHNMFMYFGSCFGLIGLSGYILYLILTIKGIFESNKMYGNVKVTCSLLMLFIAFAVEGCFDNTLNYKVPSVLYFTIFGYLVSQYINSVRQNRGKN